MKVVFHLNEVDKFKMVLSNIKNLKPYDDISSIVLLINGPAITLVTDTIGEIEGVRIEVCKNSLKSSSIELDSLKPYFIPVDAGVYRLIELQSKGYAYIKP